MPNEREDKVLRIFKKKMPWTAHGYDNVRIALDINTTINLHTKIPKGSLCTICKGGRMLCRKVKCPILTKISSYLKIKKSVNKKKIFGSSPPSVFVGRLGYPNVYVGPLVPPIRGDTSLYDVPELWFGKTIEEIVDFRLRLVRGKHRINVKKTQKSSKILEETQLLAMAQSSIDVELTLMNKPRNVFVFNSESQPIGPSAIIRGLKVSTMKLDPGIEKAFYDDDLKTTDAVIELYNKGTQVSRLQKALSVGAFGVRDQRKLVPTRWSITAIDSMISLNLAEKIKDYPLINEYRIYESNYLDNRFQVIMIPDVWKYEAIEAWYPGTLWNPSRKVIHLIGDWENHSGRTTYAQMGGCYYAARLAVCEKLSKERRQAAVVVLRETHPGYIMPVGVWQVRENVRNALRKPPFTFYSLEDVLRHIGSTFDIGLKAWVDNSKLLKDSYIQTKLTSFLRKN